MPAHDLDARTVLRIGLAVAAAVLACVAAVFLLLRAWNVPPGANRAVRAGVPARGPSLQAAPQPDLASYRAEKQRQLESGGWVDREHGIVHIPIDLAMDMLARQAASGTNR